MDGVTPKTSTCLDLTISTPGSSSGKGNDLKMKPLRLLPKRPERKDKWMNIGCPNNSEETDDSVRPNAARGEDNPPRKKLRLSKEQSRLLEESFRQNHTLNPKQKEELAETLQLRPRQVEVWFQNCRTRSKLKQTEIEYEYLKHWFGLLTERNEKLHNEVNELRAMKVSQVEELPAHRDELVLISSLTMCPRCERASTAYAEKPTPGPDSTTPSRIKQLLCNNVDNPSPLIKDN